MKKKLIRLQAYAFLLLLIVGLGSCSKKSTEPDPAPDYQLGKNRFTTEVDGDTREYYVHVPTSYDTRTATPVVFMLHGTSQDGEFHYNNSGWKEVGEAENILTVFPTSWTYCIIKDNYTRTTTKWHVYPAEFDYCAAEQPRDDIKFIRQVVAEIKQRFNVDSKRMYLAGFSNGGQMAGRCAVEMSDVFAAIVESAGTLPRDTTFVPMRKLPVLFQFGNSDDRWVGSDTLSIPMAYFDSLFTMDHFMGVVRTHAATFGLDTTTYVVSGDSNSVLTATFSANPPNPTNVFHFAMIKGMKHVYPNGTNHRLKGAELNWDWMKQFTLP